jgi:tetratricopeptide (TPR) repeat protein
MQKEVQSYYYGAMQSFKQVTTSILAALLCSAPVAMSADSQTSKGWEQQEKAGEEAFFNAEYGDAERLLKQSVIKGAALGETDLRFAKSLGELGHLYTVRGRFSEAEPLLEEEFHIKQTVAGPNNIEILPDMGSLIHFYLAHGTAAKAEPMTEDLINLVEGKLKEERAQKHGTVTLKPGQPLTAWAGTAALAVRNPLLDWAITCDNLGDAYRARGKFDLAERLYKDSLDIKTTIFGPEHLSLANSYDNLGTLALEKNQDAVAEDYYRDSLEMTAKILSLKNSQVFSRLDKLAKCLIKEKKYSQAEQLYLEAQDFWKEKPSHNGSEARAKYALGSLYVEEKKYAEAAPVLQQGLRLAEAYYGGDSISLVPYLQRYADALFFLGKNEETNQLRQRANTIAGAGTTQ